MADKGFPKIEESVLNAGAFLVMPPFHRENRQFSDKENLTGYRIASVRIHVERAIQRLKTFGVLKFIEQRMYKHMNKILVVLAYIVNNFDPLIADGIDPSLLEPIVEVEETGDNYEVPEMPEEPMDESDFELDSLIQHLDE